MPLRLVFSPRFPVPRFAVSRFSLASGALRRAVDALTAVFLACAAAFACAIAAAPAAAQEFEDTIGQRMQACVACHGKEGRASPDGYLPRIAGKPAGYLYEQLQNFREGRRKNTAMSRLLANLSDEYLHEIAEYFSTLALPHPPPQVPAATASALVLGETLVRRGDAQRELPACADCHGETLTGVQPDVPGLLGLSRDYLAGQLGAWKNGLRHAREPDCMARIAERLSPVDVSALANWLSSRPVPADAQPAAAAPVEAPLRCAGARRAEAQTTHDASNAVQRGAYLARVGNCSGCHTQPGAPEYAGGRGIETPFGIVYGSNLTPDARTGIGDWSADDFWNAMHEGRAKDGRLLYPAFPYPNFTLLTREDSDAIFAFLRTLPAVEKPRRPHALRFPYDRQASLSVWRALSFEPARFAPDPRRSEQWNRGAYLVRGLGHCGACHSPRNFLGATVRSAELGGSTLPTGEWHAPSLTRRDEAGVAHWSIEEIVALLKTGRSSDATTLGPMGEVVFRSTRFISDADLEAIAVFLKSLPEEAAPPVDEQPVDDAVATRGRTLYRDRCAQCHADDGNGVPGAVAALAGNRAVTSPSPTNVIRIVLDGGFAPATPGHPRPYGMPPFSHVLTDDDVAAVVTYIRTAWGNRASGISSLDVLRHR